MILEHVRGAAVGAVAVATLSGCGATDEQLRARAAFDMKCKEEKLEIVEIDSQTKGVRGCGHQATYVERCTGTYQADCTWVMNNVTEPKSNDDD